MSAQALPKEWTHHLVQVNPDSDVKIHYVDCPATSPSSQTPPRTLLLIHGFPQTWFEFRHVIPSLTALGLRIIAVDYRGAGASTRPVGGYDKMSMGKDLGNLVTRVLGLEKVLVLGHDIGSMVAVGMTLQFRDVVEGLMIMEGPSPGTKAYDKITRDDKFTYGPLYHWFFHAQADVPELLSHGKEREYISHFFTRLCYNPGFFTKADLDVYADAYSQFGAMRAGFDTYRAFRTDRTHFQEHMSKNPKLTMPVLAAAGDACFFAEVKIRLIGDGIRLTRQYYEDMAKEFAADVTFKIVERSGHWMPEENPEGFVKMVKEFLTEKKFL